MIMLTAALWSKPYADEHEAIEAWEGGRDFKIMPDGPYCSIRDIELLKTHGTIMLFYCKGKLVKVN